MFAPVGTEEIIPRKSYPIVTAAIVAVNVLFNNRHNFLNL